MDPVGSGDKTIKDVQAHLRAKYGAQLEEAHKRFEELDTKPREASPAKTNDENFRALNKCLRLQQQWLAEAARLEPSGDGTQWGGRFSSSCPDQVNLFQIIEDQLLRERFMAWPNHPQPQITSGLQEVIDGDEPIKSLDKIVWDRLCFVQAQIDAMRQREEDPSLSEEHVRATLQRMRQLKAMLQAAKLPPDAEMRGPLFSNNEAGRSLPEIISLQVHREKNEDKKFKSVLKSGLQEVIDGSKEQLDKTVLDRLCFLQEYYAAEGDRDWIQDPLLEQKLDALEVGSETHERRRREREQRTKQTVQTILQHMRQQKSGGHAPAQSGCLSEPQLDAKQKQATEGNVVPFLTKVAADTGRADAPKWKQPAVSLDDFYAYMPMHNYIFAPSRKSWPTSSVNARLGSVSLVDANGRPSLDGHGKQKTIPAGLWLDQNRPVEQMGWAPGLPMVIRDRLISEGGWIGRPNVNCFNLYRPPIIVPGDAAEAQRWLEHLNKVFGADANQIVKWLAHRVQRPQEKINHALVLGGPQGIGKDTSLEPVKQAVGPWNFCEVSPQHMLGRFNGYLKSVILRVNEARDLGGTDRFSFYDHMKAYAAAPPDVWSTKRTCANIASLIAAE